MGSCNEEEGMTANRKQNRRAKAGASREQDKETASREAIVEFGEVVYDHFWDSGGPGAGAESECVFRWRDKYACHSSYGGTTGPFDDILTAIHGAALNAVASATVHISSTELSSEEIAELLWDMDSMGAGFLINGEPWGFNEEGTAVRRVAKWQCRVGTQQLALATSVNSRTTMEFD
jgi:hypothetical protein